MYRSEEEIRAYLEKYFAYYDDFIIKNNAVNIDESLLSEPNFDRNETALSIQFGTVSGSFNISSSVIKTLKGCPTYVGGTFSIMDCKNLTSLKYGPKHVEGNYYCTNTNIKELRWLPDYAGTFVFEWDKNLNLLPLLRCGNYKDIDLIRGKYQTLPITHIINTHRGNSPKAVLNGAIALVEAGYASNVGIGK